MSFESVHDPRTALVQQKYFSLQPKPLQRWLWRQAIPPAAERVFWLHWEAGQQNGDWCSEIPLKRVAFECYVDLSTVTRAYQILKALKLIKREDPGRDPNNPFQQATAITEVQLPHEFLSELAKSPNRPSKSQHQKPAEMQETPPQKAPNAQQTPTPPEASAQRPRLSRGHTQEMWSRASAAERTRYFVACRDRLTSLEFDENSQLTAKDRAEILSQLSQIAAARPTTTAPTAPKLATPTPHSPTATGSRRLSVLELARLRKQVLEVVAPAAQPEIFRQVIWAVEQGALQRFTASLAINIALKKIRESAWSKPHRIPPNWLPRALNSAHAQPEPCSAA